ncbi:MAG: VWA domain-containing protein [Deltaproteobacteria bacterium]|nr:VWA domain-containing protein [Deltaproteobacteria bacterium]
MGILNPAALPLLAVLGILVLIYLRERWRTRIEVPSMLFWSLVKEDKARVRRFTPSLLFLLQALLLALLIGGVLHPFRSQIVTETRGNRHILVIDTSASMQAREGRTQRFDLARDQAKKVVQSFNVLDEVMLISVSTRPLVVSGLTKDHLLILHLLETLKPVDTGTNLDLGIELALAQRDREGRQGQIYVFTDQPTNVLNLSADKLKELAYYRVGKTDDNVGVAALHLHQNPFQSYSQAQAYVVVRNYAARPKTGILTVRLNEKQMLRREFTLPAREATSFSVKGFEGPGKLIAQIETDDALRIDNQALAWLAELRDRRLVLVSGVKGLQEEITRVSEAIPGLILTVLTPERFSPAEVRPQDVVLFHQFVPSATVSANSLYVFPQPQNPLFPAVAEAEDVSILDWREEHEMLRNLHYVDALPLKKARVLALPSWAQVLISSRTKTSEVPLAFTGEKDGHRVACFAFDLGKGNLTNSDNMTLLLLFLNTMRWLSPADPTTPTLVPTGEAFFLPPGAGPDSLRLLSPQGEEQKIETDVVEIDRVGEYRLTGSRYRGTLYANLFDEPESDIGRREENSQPVTMTQVAAKAPQELTQSVPVEFGRTLYYGAVSLILLEWLYSLWRYYRTSRA